MKSICMVVQNYYDIDPRVRRKAECLLAEGYSVDVIALRSPSHREQVYELNGVRVFTISQQKERGSAFQYIYEYLAFFIKVLVKLSILMFSKRYDAIDVNTLPDFLVFATMFAKVMGARVILDMHEVMPEFYMSKFGVAGSHWMIRLIKLQEKLSIGFADRIIVINEPIQTLLESRGLPTSKTTVMLNSVDEALFHRKVYKTRKDMPFIMMYHGTLTLIYGLDIALRSFAKVHAEMRGAEFWVVGDGPELGKLQSLADELGIAQKVKFINSIPQQEIPELLAQSTVGVLATRQDIFLDLSFSNKLSEYIVMKKPVIASRLKTIRYYFSENALAYFEPHDENELGRRMLELYRDSGCRQQLVDCAAKEYAAINWGVMRQRYIDLVNSLTS